ncbi:ATP-binding protein [Nocardioides sp. Leaf307]|uniref:ATP-binding protein n=1 Tax=Nocardioides sp. Leaf307 TaxID=1736331 RepID=UPI000ACDB299|nr:ATP-binding protein [Nocardioides sp. Leaf307]
MPPRRMLAVAALALLTGAMGLAAVRAAPDAGHAIGIWPVGLASGLLLLARRRAVPVLAALVLALAVLTIWLGGRPGDVAVGYGAGVALETVVVWAILSQGEEGRWRLRHDADLRRYVVACLAGAAVGASTGALTSAVTGFGDPALVALALAVSHLGSQLVLTPMWSRLPDHAAIAGRGERVLQWAAVVTVAPAVFVPTDLPSVVFLVVPVLAWSALRLRAPEALAQLVAVLAFAVLMSASGRGPFTDAPGRFDLDPDLRGVLLSAFIATCALIVVPLLLRVGEHIRAARTAAAERDTLERVVHSASDAIIGADLERRITLFNPGAEQLLGYTAAEVMGRDSAMLHSPHGVQRKAAELGVADDFDTVAGRMLEPGQAGAYIGFVRKDGTERTHSMTLDRILDDRGRPVGYLSISEDVTERLEAERAVQDALERLREVDAVKDAFISSVSHELRTPITSIVGYLEMLEEGDFGALGDAQLRAVRRVIGNSDRLLGLVDDLLTLSTVQHDGLGMAEKVLDLGEVVRAGCAVVSPGLERGSTVLEVDLPDEPLPVVGDRDLLERVVINLVGNAVKFTPDGGRVGVRLVAGTGPGETCHVLTVSDTGIGIPATELEHLFTRFFRSSNAQKQAIPGSGLGLSIAHAVVARHGGRMEVDSALGEGATFTVHLPAVT